MHVTGLRPERNAEPLGAVTSSGSPHTARNWKPLPAYSSRLAPSHGQKLSGWTCVPAAVSVSTIRESW